jgi:hypothetical protein
MMMRLNYNLTAAWLIKELSAFVEPEGALGCSQKFSAKDNSEPERTSSYPKILFL